MNPLQDTRNEYISLDIHILKTAKINPYNCNFLVEEALKMKLEGSREAELYKKELEDIWYSDKSETDTRIISDGELEFMISTEFAKEWQPKYLNVMEPLQEPEPDPEKKLSSTPDVTPVIEKDTAPCPTLLIGLLYRWLVTKKPDLLPKLKPNQRKHNKQDRVVDLIENIRKESGVTDQYLARSTIKKELKKGQKAIKQRIPDL